MKRLLVILEAGDRWPSGVVRGLAYRDLFASHGFSTNFEARQPLRMMDWIAGLPPICHRGFIRLFIRDRLMGLANRASERRLLKLASNADIVYLSKVRSYPLIRALCSETQARVVYDFGDALWLAPDSNSEQFHEALRKVDAVTTDNELTADYVRSFNASCTVIPDAPQVEEFDKRRAELRNKPDDRIILGWIGMPSTAYNLYVIWEALEELFRRHPNLHLRLVGVGDDLRNLPPFEKVRFSYRPSYNQAEMIEEVFKMHIGLFPLQNVEKSRVRGVLKAAIYMSGEACVVGSPVGQCVDVIQDGVNGLLAHSTQEWIDKLEILITDPHLRHRIVQNGLETVRSQFRLDQSFAKLKNVLLNGG
jgi:glycosyltransferase involved in cell wall biosynthesis